MFKKGDLVVGLFSNISYDQNNMKLTYFGHKILIKLLTYLFLDLATTDILCRAFFGKVFFVRESERALLRITTQTDDVAEATLFAYIMLKTSSKYVHK
jgi:hypothetical protein